MKELVNFTKQARQTILRQICKHFGLDFHRVVGDTPLDENLRYTFRALEEAGFRDSLYICTLKDSLNVMDLFNPKKFNDSELLMHFVEGEGLEERQSNYVLCFTSFGSRFVLYAAPAYEGLGGLFLKTPSGDGYVIEPLDNYLKFTYPRNDSIDITE